MTDNAKLARHGLGLNGDGSTTTIELLAEENRKLRQEIAALRAAQVPAGWRVTEYTREDGMIVWEDETREWFGRKKRSYFANTIGFPTPNAAIAAIEEMSK